MTVGAVSVVGCGKTALELMDLAVAADFPTRVLCLLNADAKTNRALLVARVERAVQTGQLSERRGERILEHAITHREHLRLMECDLVLEALEDTLHDKSVALRKLQDRMSGGAVLVACSATIPVERFARRLPRPEQFLAVSFPNPVQEASEVELRATDRTAPGVVQATGHFFRALGMTSVSAPVGRTDLRPHVPAGWAAPSAPIPLAAAGSADS